MKINLHFQPCKQCDCQFSANCKGSPYHKFCPSCIEETFKPVEKPRYKFHLLYRIGHNIKKTFYMMFGCVGFCCVSLYYICCRGGSEQ